MGNGYLNALHLISRVELVRKHWYSIRFSKIKFKMHLELKNTNLIIKSNKLLLKNLERIVLKLKKTIILTVQLDMEKKKRMEKRISLSKS